MWRDHPFIERNKAAKRAVEVEVGGEENGVGGGGGTGFDQI